VIHAAQTAFFVTAEEKACSAVRAEVVYEANVAVGVSVRYQLLIEDLHAHRSAVGFRNFG
jgi:hypothetical protein